MIKTFSVPWSARTLDGKPYILTASKNAFNTVWERLLLEALNTPVSVNTHHVPQFATE